jgi:hypothetical protein
MCANVYHERAEKDVTFLEDKLRKEKRADGFSICIDICY